MRGSTRSTSPPESEESRARRAAERHFSPLLRQVRTGVARRPCRWPRPSIRRSGSSTPSNTSTPSAICCHPRPGSWWMSWGRSSKPKHRESPWPKEPARRCPVPHPAQCGDVRLLVRRHGAARCLIRGAVLVRGREQLGGRVGAYIADPMLTSAGDPNPRYKVAKLLMTEFPPGSRVVAYTPGSAFGAIHFRSTSSHT